MHILNSSLNETINQVYSTSITLWEFIFVTAASNLFVLLTLDISRSIVFTPMLGTACVQYFLCAYVSGIVEQSFENVGNALYDSNWYLLQPNQRKDFLKIFMITTKTKTLTVGPFGFCSLERFSKVRRSQSKNFNKPFHLH